MNCSTGGGSFPTSVKFSFTVCSLATASVNPLRTCSMLASVRRDHPLLLDDKGYAVAIRPFGSMAANSSLSAAETAACAR